MFEFFIHVCAVACLYGILALSLNLQIGFSGLVNFGQIVLFGCGAYGAAFAHMLGFHPAFGLVGALALVVLMSLFLARLGRNLTSDYWGIATLSIAEIVRIVLTNEQSWSGGAQGISGLPRLFGGLPSPSDQLARLAVFAVLLVIAWLVSRRITASRFGLGIKLMREEPNLALSLGYDLAANRRIVMMAGGVMAATAGFLFAHYLTFVGPDQLVSSETFLIWSMVIIGGLGNNLGVVAGAFILQFAMAYVPFLKDIFHLPSDFVAAARLTIVGGGLLVFLLWRPAGLFPERVGGRRAR